MASIRKILISILIIWSLNIFCQPALAKNESVSPAPNTAPNTKPDKPWVAIDFSLSPSIAYFFYQEYSRLTKYGIYDDIAGLIYGGESAFKININPGGMGFMVVPFDVAIYGSKNLLYTGTSGKDGEPYGSLVTHNQGIFLFWYRGLAGPSWTFLDHYRFNFLSGYGYKYTKQEGIVGYISRKNQISYIPLVLQFQYSNGALRSLLHLEYDIFLRGVQESQFHGDAANQIDYLKNNQDKGYGIRGLAEFSFHGVTIAPFFNYFWVDDSQIAIITNNLNTNANVAGFEPRNITIETGVKVGYQF